MSTAPVPPIRLMICDDHQLLTDALTFTVRADPEIELVSPAFHDPEVAIMEAVKHRPDVVLMDVWFEGRQMNGIDATHAISEQAPEVAVVIVTGQEEDRYLVEAVEAGAAGFLRKRDTAQEVVEAAKAAGRGKVLIDPAMLLRVLPHVTRERDETDDARRRLETLTPREEQILTLLAHGGRNEDVASELHISTQTVQSHIHHILRKLDVRSKLEAVVFASSISD